MANQESGKTSSRWPLYSLLIAVAPAVGYGLAYLYESEFCNVFGIPVGFVVIGWTSIITAIGSFAAFLAVILFVLHNIYFLRLFGFRIGHLSTWARLASRHLTMFLLMLLVFLRYRAFVPNLAFWVFLAPSYYLIGDLLSPLITQATVKGYPNKLKAYEEQYTLPTFVRSVPSWVLLLAMVSLMSAWCANFEGRKAALSQESFMVPSINTNSVVLRTYGDRLICSPFDRQTRRTENRFFIIQLGSDPDLRLMVEEVGPLTPIGLFRRCQPRI